MTSKRPRRAKRPLPEPERKASLVPHGVAAVALAVAYYGANAIMRPHPASIQRAVRAFVILLAGLDVCVAWASRGSGFGVAVIGMLLLAMTLGSSRVGLRVS